MLTLCLEGTQIYFCFVFISLFLLLFLLFCFVIDSDFAYIVDGNKDNENADNTTKC